MTLVRPARLLGRLAALTLLFVPGLTRTASAAAPELYDGFDGRVLDGWTATQGVATSQRWAREGTHGARAISDATNAGYLMWGAEDLGQGRRTARFSAWMRVTSMDASAPVGMFSIKNAKGVNHFDFFRDADSGRWRWDLYRENHGFSTMKAVLRRWYFVEVVVDFGGAGGSAYTARVSIDGVPQPSISSPGQPGTSVRAVWLGSDNLGKSHIRQYDSVTVSVSDTSQ